MNPLSIRSLRATTTALVLAFMPFTTAHAQSPQRSSIDVPFAFTYGLSTIPAGHYTVSRTSDHIVSLTHGKKTWLGITSPEPDTVVAREGKAVFHKIGGQYFLREFWSAGNTMHLSVTESKVERSAVKTYLASAHSEPVNFQLAVVELR